MYNVYIIANAFIAEIERGLKEFRWGVEKRTLSLELRRVTVMEGEGWAESTLYDNGKGPNEKE